MSDYENELKETIRQGIRKQDSLNPQKFRYTKAFNNLPKDNTHIVAITLFKFQEQDKGKIKPNNFIVTAFLKEIDR